MKKYPIFAANRLFLDKLGYESEKELLHESKRCFQNCIFLDDVDASIEKTKNGLFDKGSFSLTMRLVRKDGTDFWITAQGKAVITAESQPVVVVSFTDGMALNVEQIRELENARAEAEHASAAKTEFLSRMSHDMRTPLNAIIGFTDLAAIENDFEAMKEYLIQIGISGKFMLGLVNDVLDMSRIEGGTLELKSEVFEQDELLEYVRAAVLPKSKEKNIELDIIGDNNPVPILADKLRVEQIVCNLLINAVKYTPDGGNVSFTISRFNTSKIDETTGIRFVVTDNGIGMSESYQKKAFEAFSREETGTHAVTQGTGLGLSIVQSLVKAMGGTIKIESEQNKGTRVVVHLIFPIAKDVVKQRKKAENEVECDNLKGKLVLVAEDNDINAVVLGRLLSTRGVEFERAENGEIALNMFMENEAKHYDAILMDIRMPVMDGLEATRAIRRLTRLDAQTIPIIAVTANAFEEDMKDCIRAGMNAHIGKPIDSKELFVTLSKYCKK